MNKGPEFTIPKSNDIPNPNLVPGPGSYNIQERRPKSAKSRMSKAERLQKLDNSVPGVGHYNLFKDEGKGVSFTKSTRKVGGMGVSKSAAQNPGPGTYHMPSWNDGNGVSILERHPERAGNQYPGPGMYDISLNDKGVSYSFKGTEVIDPVMKERLKTPSMNRYNPKTHLVTERVKGGIIGTGAKGSIATKDQNPGPGYYTVYDVNGKPKGCTIGERLQPIQSFATPGPGYYSSEE